MKSLDQVNQDGDYNDVGETITIKAVVVAKSKPSASEIYLDGTKQDSVSPDIQNTDTGGNVSNITMCFVTTFNINLRFAKYLTGCICSI